MYTLSQPMKALSMGLKKKYNKFTFYALIEPSQKGQMDSREELFKKGRKACLKDCAVL